MRWVTESRAPVAVKLLPLPASSPARRRAAWLVPARMPTNAGPGVGTKGTFSPISRIGGHRLVYGPIIPLCQQREIVGNQATQGPVAQLLMYTQEILELESQLQTAQTLRRILRVSVFSVFVGAVLLYIFNVLAWQDHVLKKQVDWPVAILLIFMLAYIIIYSMVKAVAEDPSSTSDKSYDVPRLELELELELAQERKRLHAVSLNLDVPTRQLIYRDSVPSEIDRYRNESKYYRRVHNFLQAIIIIGALAGSTLTSLLQSVPPLRWFAVGTTFAVGVAAGFTGYFKFRERSFYLQQTSDSIEQEFSAVGLGIGRYKGKVESEAITEFTEQVELLKIEQRKRQQQLEQPSEGRESVQ